MLNWEIIKHPLNWLIVVFMLIIAGFIIDIFTLKFGASKGNTNTSGVEDSGQTVS